LISSFRVAVNKLEGDKAATVTLAILFYGKENRKCAVFLV